MDIITPLSIDVARYEIRRFRHRLVILGLIMLNCPACKKELLQEQPTPPIVMPQMPEQRSFEFDRLYDRILGMLIGSAIGDAMGAPVEMWQRREIQAQYGYINDLIQVTREPSGEGTWDYNLPPGATTDDTRWKALVADYLVSLPSLERDRLNARTFASFILQRYTDEIVRLKGIDSLEPAPFEDQMRRIGWLQEWAVVAKPFVEGDIDKYIQMLNMFYGGEMTCAGMLFSPALASCFPGAPEAAYEVTFELDIYDIGNAKDMAAITGAMVAEALGDSATPETIFGVLRDVDPRGYTRSRLVGRTAYKLYQDARRIVYEARRPINADTAATPFNFDIHTTGRDSLSLFYQYRAYELLDKQTFRVPWHPAEIHLINLTALVFSDFDFRMAMEFICNFGRDTDTIAAISGAIIGAYLGAQSLPKDMVEQTIESNRQLGIDLEMIARKLTNVTVKNHALRE